jgi:ParB-like chromosome segregation protein Spo0J
MQLQVEYVPIDTIKPYKNNAKLHPAEQIEQIKKSMQEFGNIDPLGIWHGEIVEGHGRYEACKQLGYTEIPVIRLDELTDEQRKAYALVHNQLTMNSGWDNELLNLELDGLGDFDMDEFGFSLDDLEEPTQTITGGGEVSLDDYSDDKFSCTCPQCGFKFNPKG